jgi:hypothetical protein
MKTKVKVKTYIRGKRINDREGYIDGYMRDYKGNPCAIVIIDERFYLVPISNLELITENES